MRQRRMEEGDCKSRDWLNNRRWTCPESKARALCSPGSAAPRHSQSNFDGQAGQVNNPDFGNPGATAGRKFRYAVGFFLFTAAPAAERNCRRYCGLIDLSLEFGLMTRLTSQEQKVLCAVLLLILTGWAVKAYRTAHPDPSLPAATEVSGAL